MHIRRQAAGTLFLLVPLLSVSPIRAEDAQRDFEAEYAACRALVAAQKWNDAITAYERLFSDHPKDPRIAARIRDVGDDLRRASFMRSYEPPDPKVLFGAGVKSWNPRTLELEIEWDGEGLLDSVLVRPNEQITLLDLRFRDRVALTIARSFRVAGVLLCFDVEKCGDYLLAFDNRRNRVTGFRLFRVSGQSKVKLDGPGEFDGDEDLKFTRNSHTLKVHWGKKVVASANDRTYQGGYVAFLGGVPSRFTLKGTLDAVFHAQKLGEHQERSFAAFLAESWKAEDVIPAWALAGPRTGPAAAAFPLPHQTKLPDPARSAEHARGCLSGDRAAAREMQDLAVNALPLDALYFRAFSALGTERLKSAEALLDDLVTKVPGFTPGIALRGFVHLRLGQWEAAAGRFEAACRADPSPEVAWIGRIVLAIRDGDLDSASALLGQAAERGHGSPDLEDLGNAVQRGRRGPLWTTIHSFESKHFFVRSDHSQEMCRQVADDLDAAYESYVRALPDVGGLPRKPRVWIFSTREGYLGYARERLHDLDWTAGAYDPSLRELVVYLPIDRSDFLHTIRHEGFHAFLHGGVERAPPWFNEGLAEYFASAEPRKFAHGLVPGAPLESAIQVLRTTKRRPLRELLLLPQKTFVTDQPELNYAQSWAFAHCLLTAKEKWLRELPGAYLAALREGLSAEEVFERVMKERFAEIDSAWKSHLMNLIDD